MAANIPIGIPIDSDIIRDITPSVSDFGNPNFMYWLTVRSFFLKKAPSLLWEHLKCNKKLEYKKVCQGDIFPSILLLLEDQ